MKKCPKCNIEKNLNEFSKNSLKKDGLQRICKLCVKEQDARLFKQNPEKIKQRNKRYSNKTYEWFSNYKKTLYCEICGENREWVLDFHHKDPSNKDFNIGNVYRNGYSIERIKNEISKCMCVCANCHRDIHYKLKKIEP
jgi:hypothetical protein